MLIKFRPRPHSRRPRPRPEVERLEDRWVPSTVGSGPTANAYNGAIISNGIIELGVNQEGDLNVYPTNNALFPPTVQGTVPVGLRYLPMNTDATAPGCL